MGSAALLTATIINADVRAVKLDLCGLIASSRKFSTYYITHEYEIRKVSPLGLKFHFGRSARSVEQQSGISGNDMSVNVF